MFLKEILFFIVSFYNFLTFLKTSGSFRKNRKLLFKNYQFLKTNFQKNFQQQKSFLDDFKISPAPCFAPYLFFLSKFFISK